MSKGSPPPAPDPTATANAQTQSNIATATANAGLNRIDQYTPYGSSTYAINGTTPGGQPQYSQTTTLSPEQQQLYNKYTQGQNALADTAIGSLGNVQGQLGTPFSYGGPNPTGNVASPTTGTTTNISNSDPGAIQRATDAAYRSQTQYLDPQFKDAQSSLDAKLANQGLQTGGEAYDKAQNQFGLQKQQAYQSAQDAATAAGNQEQNVLFNQGLNQAGLQNSVNNQQFGQNLQAANLQNQGSTLGLQQAAYLYNQPLSTYNSLITGSQPTSPTFSNVPGVNQANTDVAGITNSGYQNQLAGYNASQQGINNLFSLGGQLGGAAILASDRRLKRNIKRVGTTSGELPIYEFSYLWDGDETRHRGLMADEVRKVIPSAVIRHPSGFDMVDYSQVKP